MLNHLSFVGNNGLGALIYKPCISEGNNNPRIVDLDLLNDSVKRVLAGESSDVIDELFEQGGSPGGARPKIYATYNEESNSLVGGSSILAQGDEHWIVKFAASIDVNDIANIELAYYYMAIDAGIEMNPSKVFTGKSGKKYFGTKRFDREGSRRLHMLSAAGLLHDDYQRSQLDYGMLIQEGGELISSAQVHECFLRRAAFNVFAHNRDDHSKNFAFLMDQQGSWKVAPAYDLTFSASSQGQHSTMCAGNATNPGAKELLELANHFSIRNAKEIIDQVRSSISKWNEYADKADVSDESKKSIWNVISKIH